MSVEQKFLFDNCFESPAPAVQPEPPAPEVPETREPELTEADLELAREEGRSEGMELGRAQGRSEAFEGIEQTTQSLLATVAERIGDLAANQEQRHEMLSREALNTATTVVARMFPSLEKSAALKEIETVVSDCLARAHDEPRLVIRVAGTILEQVKTRVDSLVGNQGFEGKVVFLADDELGTSDVRVEWADGGAERKSEDIRHGIDQVLARFLKVPVEQQVSLSTADCTPGAAATEAATKASELHGADTGETTTPAEDAPPPLVSPLDQMGLEMTKTGTATGSVPVQPNSAPTAAGLQEFNNE